MKSSVVGSLEPTPYLSAVMTELEDGKNIVKVLSQAVLVLCITCAALRMKVHVQITRPLGSSVRLESFLLLVLLPIFWLQGLHFSRSLLGERFSLHL
jgi:hypothetical protein